MRGGEYINALYSAHKKAVKIFKCHSYSKIVVLNIYGVTILFAKTSAVWKH